MAYVFCALYSVFLIYFLIGQYQTKTVLLEKSAYSFILLFPAAYWILLLGLQYYVGTDYPAYYMLFRTNRTGLYKGNKEYGFVLVCAIIEKLGLPAQSGFFIISFIDVLFFCLFFTKFHFHRPDLFLLIYFCCATSFINQMNALRQYVAMNVFCFAFYFLYKKKPIKYLLCILFASVFHRSAILLAVFYPMRMLFKRNSKRLCFVELLLGILFSFKGLDSVIIWFVGFTPYRYYLDSIYFLERNQAGFTNMLTKLIYIPFFIGAIRHMDSYSAKDRFLVHSGIFFFSIKLMSMSSFFLRRFAMYFDLLSYLPLYVYLVLLISGGKSKSSVKVFELFLFLCVVIVPYLLKTVVAPSGEYLYQSIILK